MSQTTREKAAQIVGDWSFTVLGDRDECTLLEDLEKAGLLVVDAKALRRFLDACGDKTTCSGCGANMWFFVARNGKRWPVDERGANHFGSCPNADLFRRDRL